MSDGQLNAQSGEAGDTEPQGVHRERGSWSFTIGRRQANQKKITGRERLPPAAADRAVVYVG